MFHANAVFNQDISGWNTERALDMSTMFREATNFNQNLSGWCVYKVGEIYNLFNENSALTEGNLPIWGTCPGKDMSDDDGDDVPNYFDLCPGSNTNDYFTNSDGCKIPPLVCSKALQAGTWTVKMFDSYGDGWQTGTSDTGGRGLQLFLDDRTLYKEFGLCNPYEESPYECSDNYTEATIQFEMPENTTSLYWYFPGDSYGEIAAEIYDPNGELFYSITPGTREKYLEIEDCQ